MSLGTADIGALSSHNCEIRGGQVNLVLVRVDEIVIDVLIAGGDATNVAAANIVKTAARGMLHSDLEVVLLG